MKPYCRCVVEFIPSPHLMQLYTGFLELEEQGEIQLEFREVKGCNIFKPIIYVTVNGSVSIVYDELDGFNWIQGGREENLLHFQRNYPADYYFKRSFHPLLYEYAPSGCEVFPLGLNYIVEPKFGFWKLLPGWKPKLKHLLLHSKIGRKLFFPDYQPVYTADYEKAPIVAAEKRVLFVTRLWDPANAANLQIRSEYERVNQVRVESIRACIKELGTRITGGVIDSPFARTYCPDLVLPSAKTTKHEHLRNIGAHPICIATTGLHQSVGWKMGEYVAASRSIISEPLHYQLTGSFADGINYFSFHTPDVLLEHVFSLLHEDQKMLACMQANHQYYLDFVQPGAMVRNTLFQVLPQFRRHPSEIGSAVATDNP